MTSRDIDFSDLAEVYGDPDPRWDVLSARQSRETTRLHLGLAVFFCGMIMGAILTTAALSVAKMTPWTAVQAERRG